MEFIRKGRISSVNPNKCTAKVVFDDQEDLVSKELLIVVSGSKGDKQYWMPSLHEKVVCLMVPNGNGEGYIIGSYYTEEDKPSVTNANKRSVHYKDGAMVEYDSEKHILTLDFSKVTGAQIVIKNCTITKSGVIENG